MRRLSSLTCLRQTQQGLSSQMWMRTVQQTDLHCELTGLNVLRGLSGKPEPGCLNTEADWATFGHFEVSNYLIHDWRIRRGLRRSRGSSSCSCAGAAILESSESKCVQATISHGRSRRWETWTAFRRLKHDLTHSSASFLIFPESIP